jgi:hypothetical protein
MIPSRTNGEETRLNIELKLTKVTALVLGLWITHERYVGMRRLLPHATNSREISIIPLMSFLRFLILLSLVVWLGGIIFLAFVEAPTVFSPGLLPTRQVAGSIVGRSLELLHYIAIASGMIFLTASMIYSRMATGSAKPFAARHVLIVMMLIITLISQFAVTPKMHAIRAEAGVIDKLTVDDPKRQEFERLHFWSEKFEGGVLLLGLIALYATSQALR